MERFYRKPLGTIFLSAGLLTEDDLEKALDQGRTTGKRLGEILLGLGRVEEEDLVEARALQLDMPHIHLQNHTVDAATAKMVPESVARSYVLIPINASEGRVVLAMSDPLNVEAIDLVQRTTRCKVEPLLASDSAIERLINETFGSPTSEAISGALEEALGAMGALADVEVGDAEADQDDTDISETRRASEQAPIVRTVNHILKEAVEARASDIHIEPRRAGCEVRYRLDGALREIRTLPKSIQAAVLSRIKIMGDLDIAEKRIPQDGRIAINVANRAVDIRLSTLPTQFGERIVMRLLDRGVNTLSLDQLGFSEVARGHLDEMIRRPYGIVLVTGPTGSGKTTSLYSFLNEVKCPEVNIITVEDPVEYELEGISQSNVNVRAGLTFAAQLRSILRQDPDIVLVGEIRDQETADIAFRAALTGHLVFSTLHCNEAAGAFARLTDMGVEPFLISSAISGVLAQRLVRTVCARCREEYQPEDDVTLAFKEEGFDISGRKLLRGRGCNACGNTGYKGRTLIAETLRVNQEIRKLAMEKAATDLIREVAVYNGMETMRRDGMNKVLQGITTFDELRKKVFLSED
ncbi:MAG: Flp pilus assembly complex ATPase component TadA [Armatimonadetes bacterium]|nr:Flp pilus assembly complex ATPase component TadA [Armatimonadota bacterium]